MSFRGAGTERPVLMDEEIVKSIATKHKKTPSQVILARFYNLKK